MNARHDPAAAGVSVRPARPDDVAAATLVFWAAAHAYAALAGSSVRAHTVLVDLWPRPGHSASYEHALVAELDGAPVGVVIAFRARDRYRLHRGLVRAGLRELGPSRWPALLAGLSATVLATPRPPRDAYYVATIAVARRARRLGVGSTLGYHAELAAAARGLPLIAAHTGTGHAVARHALERYGMRMWRARRGGYALYVKRVSVC